MLKIKPAFESIVESKSNIQILTHLVGGICILFVNLYHMSLISDTEGDLTETLCISHSSFPPKCILSLQQCRDTLVLKTTVKSCDWNSTQDCSSKKVVLCKSWALYIVWIPHWIVMNKVFKLDTCNLRGFGNTELDYQLWKKIKPLLDPLSPL